MLHELEHMLKQLKETEWKLHRDVFEEGEIQKEIQEINNFPELLHDVHQKLSTLREAEPHELAKILTTLIDIYQSLCSCTNNIELTRELVSQLRTCLTQSKAGEHDA